MPKKSRTYLLIEERLGRPLHKHVLKARGTQPRASTSWERIAADLSEKTGVHVTSETLRLWFYDAEQQRLKATSNAPAA